MAQREQFSSRIGFLLISAGCAIGLGNVWRFPYIVGEYGGAAFVLIYLLFLVILGLPVMAMEFAVGRASQKSCAQSFDLLEPKGTRWHWYKWLGLGGSFLLMMFYTTICGWMLSYVVKYAGGTFSGASPEQVGNIFTAMLANPVEVVGWMAIVVILGFLVCSIGLQKGVERITKAMMTCLFVVMAILCIRSITLEGGAEGLAFYLIPDFSRMFVDGWTSFGEAVYAAMGQAFFTLSIGVSSMAIFGSYIGKERRLFGEALRVGALDTSVALMAGLIIFPACFAFGVNPGEGPGLVFVTLPSVFDQMWLGQLWGVLFFVFMSFAALSTVIGVFENIMSFFLDQWGWSRKKTALVCAVIVFIGSLPCALGFNVLSGVIIPSVGDIQSFEDFLFSSTILPLGSLVYVLFCVSRRGWGWKGFLNEANTGEKGLAFPKAAYLWVRFGIPALIVAILVAGYLVKFLL